MQSEPKKAVSTSIETANCRKRPRMLSQGMSFCEQIALFAAKVAADFGPAEAGGIEKGQGFRAERLIYLAGQKASGREAAGRDAAYGTVEKERIPVGHEKRQSGLVFRILRRFHI